jgi:aminoglycoside/choline kinase family phosphotransferase
MVTTVHHTMTESGLAGLAAVVEAALGRRPVHIDSVPAGLGDRHFLRLSFQDGEPRSLIARLEADSPLWIATEGRASSPSNPANRDSRTSMPPRWLPDPPLEPTRRTLEAEGLPVPASALSRPDLGLDLLEDLGTRTLLSLRGEDRIAGYRAACALLPRLQRITAGADPIPAFSRLYDPALVASKAWKWLNWTIPLILGRPATPTETTETHALFDHIAALASSAPRVLSHRDFKAENLHVVPPRAAGAPERIVMIDIQGAFLAPPEYDLVCLLYDLQTTLPESLIAELTDATRASLPDPPAPELFAERFDALALARLCKDVSHVVHAACARGDRRRWPEIPRGLELIRRAGGRRAHSFPGLDALHDLTGSLIEAFFKDPAKAMGRPRAGGETP